MDKKICLICGKELISKQKKYCGEKCRTKFYNKKHYNPERQKAYLDKKRQENIEGLIQCKICDKYYKFLGPHVRQTHKITLDEYKEEFGLNKTKSLITEEIKKIKREYVKKIYPEVVENNLIKKGRKTRYIKGDIRAGNYERREETLKVLRQQSFVKKKLYTPKKI